MPTYRHPVCSALFVVSWFAFAQSWAATPQDLADASLEQLLNTKVVSAGKKAESLKNTAASVFVITSEDIRRSGMHSLPEVLRLAPGVQVARTVSGNWSISIRGFNGDFANKLLVLVDGRIVYNDEWAGVFWDMEEMPLDDIERIEVVRGPAAALWGPNAVNGVINILTKRADETQGALITAEAGNRDANTSARYGGAIGADATYRITARYGDADALPASLAGGFTPSHGWTSDSAGFRVDWNPSSSDALFFTGQAYHSSLGESGIFVTPQNPYPAAQDMLEDSLSGNLLGQWEHKFSDGSALQGRFTWDRVEHGVGELPMGYTALDGQLQYHFSLGERNDLVWGAEYRAQSYAASVTPGHFQRLAETTVNSTSSFLEDEITLAPDRLYVIAAVNGGEYRFAGFQIQPTGRLLWTPKKNLTSWAAVSRAVRTPSLIERGLDFNFVAFPAGQGTLGILSLMANPSAQPEAVVAFEAGQRIGVSRRISLDFSGFWNRYTHVLFLSPRASYFVPGPIPYLDVPIMFDNVYRAQSHGLEATATWNASARWRLFGGFSWLRVTLQPYPGWPEPSYPINNAPQYQWEARSNLDLTRRLQLDTAFYYTGSIAEAAVPSHLRADLHLAWRPRKAVEFSAGIQDAFEPYHAELPSLYEYETLLVGRNVYGAITWKF